MSNTTTDNNDQHPGSSREITSSKNDELSSVQTDVDAVTEGIDTVAVLDDTSTCVACGKEGNSDNMNTCNKCKSVKYCNAACKKKHRKKHKKACERKVAELHEEALFKEPPQREECPLCFLPYLYGDSTEIFMSCCGKTICDGCIHAMKESEGGDRLCPFCRTPPASGKKEDMKRIKTLIEKGNAEAFNVFAGYYDRGDYGLPQDHQKANELYQKAGELGCSDGYYNLGCSYNQGSGVNMDKKRACHYFELAAMMGDLDARYTLGVWDYKAGNNDRAIKHFVMVAKAGDKKSLEKVKKIFMQGLVTKDEYASTLRVYHDRQKEMKSEMRNKAAAAQSQG